MQYINVNILRRGNNNFYLGMCKVSNQYDKDNLSYGHKTNDGSKETWMITYVCV